MNLAAFAVIVARERETGVGDDISSLYGLGADRPLLAWPMTIAMLALAGLPGDGRLLRQGLPDRRGGRQRLRLARRRDRPRLGDLARLLPARRGGGLDARAGGAPVPRRRGCGAPAIAGGSPEARRRSVAATRARGHRGSCSRRSSRSRCVRGGDDLLRRLSRAAARPRARRGAALTSCSSARRRAVDVNAAGGAGPTTGRVPGDVGDYPCERRLARDPPGSAHLPAQPR